MGRILSVRTVVFIGGGKTMMIIDEFKCSVFFLFLYIFGFFIVKM